MPTSSQALILINTDGADSSAKLALSRKSSENVFPCRLSRINTDTYFMLCKQPSENIRYTSSSEKPSAQTLTQDHNVPSRYRSILTYDTDTESFQWKLVADLNGQRGSSVSEKKSDTEANAETDEKVQRSKFPSRPSSAGVNELASKFSLFSVNSSVYERLVGLGFRPRNKENGAQNGNFKQRTPLRSSGTTSSPELKSWRKEDDKSFGFVDKVEVLHLEDSTAASKIKERLKGDSDFPEGGTEEEIDEETAQSLIDDLKKQLGWDKRIKPSIHMRKRKPRERPLTVVLSLRDNDDFTHEEVKSVVEIKGNVQITELQYDPLAIRASDPDMNSRWYVTLSSKEQAERLVKKGFIVGEDKILVYSFDDVMRREVATYKYFESVQDDHKRLKRKRSSGLRK